MKKKKKKTEKKRLLLDNIYIQFSLSVIIL